MNLTTICEEENSNSNRTVFDRQILEVNAEPTTSNNHGPLNDNHASSGKKPRTKSSITITKVPQKGSNAVTINIDMKKVYKPNKEVMTCLVETNDSDSSDSDNNNYYNSLSRVNNQSHYQAMSHSKLTRPFQEQARPSESNEVLSSPSLYGPNQPKNVESDLSYHTISRDASNLSMSLNLSGFGNLTGLDSNGAEAATEVNLAPNNERQRSTIRHVEPAMNVSYSNVSPIISQQVRFGSGSDVFDAEMSEDSEVSARRHGQDLDPRRSLRLIQQKDRAPNVAAKASLRSMYLSQLVRPQLKKKRQRKSPKVLLHKATQTEEKYFSVDHSGLSSSETEDEEYEAPRRSRRRLNNTFVVTDTVQPVNEEMNGISADSFEYREVERNFRELPNALEQTALDALNEPMELSLTEDNQNQPMCSKDIRNSRLFHLDSRNITMRKEHPAYRRQMEKSSKQTAGPKLNFKHLLNSQHITLRKKDK